MQKRKSKVHTTTNCIRTSDINAPNTANACTARVMNLHVQRNYRCLIIYLHILLKTKETAKSYNFDIAQPK